jgi:hypothetical protein
MLGRRGKDRGGPADRRDLPRPSLTLNLLLLTAAVAALVFAARQRIEIDAEYSRVFNKTSAGSPELNQVKAELAEMDLNKDALAAELDGRLSYLEKRKSRDFFLSIDTAKNRMSLNFGNDTVRDADVRIGAPLAIEGPSGKPLAISLKGAFSVTGKQEGTGLGKYVIYLPNGSAIHSPPLTGVKRPKPGSFMVSEKDLAVIWDRIMPETRVYIF